MIMTTKILTRMGSTTIVKRLKMKITLMQIAILKSSPIISKTAIAFTILKAVQTSLRMVNPKLKSLLKRPNWQRS